MKEKSRSEISKEFQWDLTKIFKTDGDWETEYKNLEEIIPTIGAYKNTLSDTENLHKCLTLLEEISLRFERNYLYVSLKHHEDTGNTVYQGLMDRGTKLATKFSSSVSFIDSELLSLDENFIKTLISTDDRFKKYAHYFDDLYRVKNHILSPEMEEILARASEMAESAENIFSSLNDADMTFESVIAKDGTEHLLTHGRYRVLIEHEDRDIREKAYKNMFKSYINLKNTFATIYSSNVKKDLYFAQAKNYNSTMEAALSANNIPIDVYKNLIKACEKYLPVMHKYVDIRKKRLGLDEIHFYDLYTPIVKDVDAKYTYEQGKELILEGLSVLGEDYINTVKYGLSNGWIDVYENKGKRSGAFSSGAYKTEPYILLNYNDSLDNVFTLAHEMGHSMHSYNTWQTQDYIYGDYSIFVAEVASTVNEILLLHHLLDNTKDAKFEEYLINHYVEQFRTTVFRQVMFAEFEMITHEMNQNGEPLTVDSLCEVYGNLNRKYYGNDIVIDDEIKMEWARIPHFYYRFYVYQYATGFSAAVALSEKILNKEENALENYLEFLKSGSSDYPINVLKKAGVDMLKQESAEKALEVFKTFVDKL